MIKDGTIYNQRDIVLIPFPYTDLTGIKQRPALVISNNHVNQTQDRICCLITSNPTEKGIVLTEESFEAQRLPFTSWIKPHRLFTIHERIIRKKLSTVTKQFYERIISTIKKQIETDT